MIDNVRICVDCKHYKYEDNKDLREYKETIMYIRDRHLCVHPSFQTINLVTGKMNLNEKECERMRCANPSDTFFCGQYGVMWEPKNENS